MVLTIKFSQLSREALAKRQPKIEKLKAEISRLQIEALDEAMAKVVPKSVLIVIKEEVLRQIEEEKED